MTPFLNLILNWLTMPPGNLIYHLVLAFSIAGALQGAVQLWQTSQFPQAKRAILGLGILLALQALLFVVSGFMERGSPNQVNILPPLDRAVTLISLTWIAWLWAFPEPMRDRKSVV